MDELFARIAKLGIKMKIFRAIQVEDSLIGALKDREILILELLRTQGPMSMGDLLRFFPGVQLSTLSTDIKRLRVELDLVDMTVDKKDMRIHLIELSGKGLEKFKEIQAQRAKSFHPLSSAIGDDPDEINLLNRVVSRALALLDEEITQFAEYKNMS